MRRALLALLLAWGAHLPAFAFNYTFDGLTSTNCAGTLTHGATSTSAASIANMICDYNLTVGGGGCYQASVFSSAANEPPAGGISFFCGREGVQTGGEFFLNPTPGACDAELDVERSLSTEVTLNPAGAVSSVCFQGCQFDLGTAANYTIGAEVWRVGSWIGSGEVCSGDPAAQTDPGDGGTPESCGGDDEDPCTTEVETDLDDKLAEILAASLAQRSGTNPSSSAIGDFFALPTWIRTAFDRGTTDCKLHIAIPAGSVLSPVASAIANTDVCGVQSYADTYGNWFFGFCTVLWSWSIVTGARIEET